jgi:hypothetical protein
MLLMGQRVVLPLTVMALLGGIVADGHWQYFLEVLLVPPAYIGLMLAKLYLIDWPAHLVARRTASLSLVLQAGWLPLVAAAWAAALLPPTPLLPQWGTALLGAGSCLWALYVSAPAPGLTLVRALQAVYLNAALGIWGLEAAAELEAPPWRVPSEALTGEAWLLCAAGLGLQALCAAWHRVAYPRPRTSLLLLTAWGIGVASVLATASAPQWRPLQTWLVVSFVSAHRVALDFHSTALRVRMIVLAICLCLVPAILLIAQNDLAAPITRAGGLALVVAAVLNLLLAPGWHKDASDT